MDLKRILSNRRVSLVLSGALSYSTAVIVNLVTSDATNSLSTWILLFGGLIVCVILFFYAGLIDLGSKAEQLRLDRENASHRSGYQTLSRELSEYIARVRSFSPTNPLLSKVPRQLMRSACEDLYATLENEYGHKVRVSDHIEFEVTFMTESILDGKITIPAWANRDKRAPKSLQERATNINKYDGTETAHLYNDVNKTPRFIKSTSGNTYKELYPNQKSRIKSSVVWPVVDNDFNLLGALVVHCDKEGFFSDNVEKYWRETLEPYTKRLALARVLADKLHSSGMTQNF